MLLFTFYNIMSVDKNRTLFNKKVFHGKVSGTSGLSQFKFLTKTTGDTWSASDLASSFTSGNFTL